MHCHDISFRHNQKWTTHLYLVLSSLVFSDSPSNCVLNCLLKETVLNYIVVSSKITEHLQVAYYYMISCIRLSFVDFFGWNILFNHPLSTPLSCNFRFFAFLNLFFQFFLFKLLLLRAHFAIMFNMIITTPLTVNILKPRCPK